MRECRLILFAGFVFFIAGCNVFPSKLPSSTPAFLRGNTSEIRQKLLKIIPIGTSHEDAERLVESLGLELTSEPVMDSRGSGAIQCQYEGKQGLFDHTVWLIEINCPDGKVADLFCEQIGLDHGFLDLGFF